MTDESHWLRKADVPRKEDAASPDSVLRDGVKPWG